MSNEYAVNQADLTSVANAIREKGETTQQLVFPSGFVTAIESIKGGGDLNFEVVGGTDEPENPVENTIWVNTDQEITGFVFDYKEPTEPGDGVVFFKTIKQSNAGFNAITDNELHVYVQKASQYKESEGAWENTKIKIYQSGTWVDFTLNLFAEGDRCEEVTGGWKGHSDQNATFAFGETIYLFSDKNSYHNAAVYTNNKINFNGYSTLNFDIDWAENNGACFARVGLASTNTGAMASNVIASVTLVKTGRQNVQIPLSSVQNTECYVFIDMKYTTVNVYNVFAE